MTNYPFLIVFALLQIALIIQLYFIIVVHGRLRGYKKNESADVVLLPVSVIICARNEEVNLKENLSFFLEQDYPDFEVVVVNDCSSDESEFILKKFSEQYANLKVVTLNEHDRYKHGKKFAVTIGIKAAQHEHLLFTDADCRPASLNWIRHMQSNFKGNTAIVLGFSPYKRAKGFLNAFIRFETFNTALNYLSFSLAGNPYMGVGRNLSYTKTLFFKNKGFASHMHILSGDDDLFVNENANRSNTVIEIDPESHTWSEPKKTWTSLWKQKIRHMGAGKAYKSRHKRVLTIQAGSSMAFYVLLEVMAFMQTQWWLLLSIYFIRLIIQLLVYFPSMRKLKCKNLIWWFPILDLFYIFFIIVLGIVSSFKREIQWK